MNLLLKYWTKMTKFGTVKIPEDLQKCCKQEVQKTLNFSDLSLGDCCV